jgi:hypothetical protein
MDNEKPQNQFQEVHRRVRERLDRDRKIQAQDSELRRKREEKEADGARSGDS